MKEWLDTTGTPIERSAWDYHHVIARSSAHSRGQRNFVNQEGLLIPMVRTWHNIGKNALHSNVGLASVPDLRLARLITHTLLDNTELNVYDRFIDVADVVKHVAEYGEDKALVRDAKKLSRNFDQQMPYILEGQVRSIEEASRPLEAA